MQPALHSCKEISPCHDDDENGGGVKKRRFTVEQVKSLEMSFAREKKLQRQMKIQLAMELGLKPRQVAVWYQNRRARWKAKQLEQDYFILKERYERGLLEKQKLEAKVIRLTLELRMAERRTEKENISSGCSYGTDEKALEQRSSSICSDGPAKRCKVLAGQCSDNQQAVAERERGTQQLQRDVLQSQVTSGDAELSERNNQQQIASKSGDNNDNTVSQRFCNSHLVSLDGQQGMTANCFDWFNF